MSRFGRRDALLRAEAPRRTVPRIRVARPVRRVDRGAGLVPRGAGRSSGTSVPLRSRGDRERDRGPRRRARHLRRASHAGLGIPALADDPAAVQDPPAKSAASAPGAGGLFHRRQRGPDRGLPAVPADPSRGLRSRGRRGPPHAAPVPLGLGALHLLLFTSRRPRGHRAAAHPSICRRRREAARAVPPERAVPVGAAPRRAGVSRRLLGGAAADDRPPAVRDRHDLLHLPRRRSRRPAHARPARARLRRVPQEGPSDPAAAALTHRTRRHDTFALGLLLSITFLCCLPALNAPFTYDEDAGIEDNRVVHPGARFGEALAYRYSPDQARPVFFASLLLDANLWGMQPRGFRLTCFLLHLACGVLLYILLRRPPGTAEASLAGTSLFLLHPLQSESVLYIWGRSEVLSTLFGLAAMLLSLADGERDGGGANRGAWVRWAGALACMALALASKEEAIVTPVILFLWWTLAEGRPVRPGLRRAAILALPVLLFLAARPIALGGVGRQVYVRSVADNILGEGVVTLRMLRLFVLPIGQSIDHVAGIPGALRASLALAACAILLAGAVVMTVVAVRRRPGGMVLSRCAGGLLIAAVASIFYWAVPLPDLMCERRLYLPLVGAALALSGILIDSRRLAMVVGAALILLLGPALALRAHIWADPVRLWGEAARLAPEKARPLINLGVVAAEKGDRRQALDLFGRAIALEPRNAEALFNRGKLYLDAGDSARAIQDLQVAVASNPTLVRARINLGIARIDAGDLAGAEAELRSTLEIEPRNPRALTNLAEVLRATRRADQAVDYYRRALDADPTYAHAAARLGVTLENLGDPRGALSAYREFLVRGTTSSTDRQAVEDKIRALEQAAATPPQKP